MKPKTSQFLLIALILWLVILLLRAIDTPEIARQNVFTFPTLLIAATSSIVTTGICMTLLPKKRAFLTPIILFSLAVSTQIIINLVVGIKVNDTKFLLTAIFGGITYFITGLAGWLITEVSFRFFLKKSEADLHRNI